MEIPNQTVYLISHCTEFQSSLPYQNSSNSSAPVIMEKLLLNIKRLKRRQDIFEFELETVILEGKFLTQDFYHLQH